MPPPRRLILYAAAVLIVLLAGYASAMAGLAACWPPALPGDEWWQWRGHLFRALEIVARGVPSDCYVQGKWGPRAQSFAANALPLAAFVVAVAVLMETAGRALRRLWFRRRGGHAILAGGADDIAAFAAEERRRSALCLVTFSREEERSLASLFPFAETVRAWRRRSLTGALVRIGAPKARLIAAASDRDLENINMIEEALSLIPSGHRGGTQLLLRIEQPTVRVLRSHPIRQIADQRGIPLSVVSLSLLQVREGLARAMPGLYRPDGARKHHVAICGSGPMVQFIAFRVARQAYGLERERPLISILRTGRTDFAAGAYERLQAADMAVTTASAGVDPDDIQALEASIAAIALSDTPLAAIHCAGETHGEAAALADRWERVLLRLKVPIPPIVAYLPHDERIGSTGMIRTAHSPDVAEAVRLVTLVDRRARTLHEAYMAEQTKAKGAGFGALPGEAAWDLLPETMQEDNRNAADHLDYKLALVGLRAVEGAGPANRIGKRDTELLAAIEHGRWLAAKSLDGWRFGPKRDNDARLHPDMVASYDDLDEPAKQKDRDVINQIPGLLQLAGQHLQAQRRFACLVGGETVFADDGRLGRAMDAFANHHPAVFAVIVAPLDGRACVDACAFFLKRGVALEIVADPEMFARLRASGGDALVARAAEVLRQAYRIRSFRDREARDVIREEDGLPVVVDERGEVHVAHLS